MNQKISIFFLAIVMMCDTSLVIAQESIENKDSFLTEEGIPNPRAYENELLQIENKKLESDIKLAERIIEQQNIQLEQTNDLISIFWAVLGISFVVVGVFAYFQFVLPIKEQKQEIEILSKKTQEILNDLEGSIITVVKEKYKDYEENRLKVALRSLLDEKYSHMALPLIKELSLVGFSKNQIDIIFHFFEKDIHLAGEETKIGNLGFVINHLFDSIIKDGYVEKFEKFAKSFFSKPLSGNMNFYFFFSRKWLEYLSKTINLGEYESLFLVLNNIHSKSPDIANEKYRLLQRFLNYANNNRPTVLKQILDDKLFIQEFEHNKLNEVLVEVSKTYSIDIIKSFESYTDTVFFSKLTEYMNPE